MAESLLVGLDADPAFAAPVTVTPEQLAAQAREHRDIAARFASAW